MAGKEEEDIYNQTHIDIIIVVGGVVSIALLCFALFSGEFEGTIIYYGPDVKFGSLILNTPGKWWAFFLAQTALGIIDVFFYELVSPYYTQLQNFDDKIIKIKNHGKNTPTNQILFTLKSAAAFFPMIIRMTLAVVFVNTQLLTTVLVQIIKEIAVFFIVLGKIERKALKGGWEKSPGEEEIQGDNRNGEYTQLLKQRRNNIKF